MTENSPAYQLGGPPFGNIALGNSLGERPKYSLSLHALVNVLGISISDVARCVGLTRARIGHFLNLGSPVPMRRRIEFNNILREALRNYEDSIEYFESGRCGPDMASDVLPGGLDAAKAVLKVCSELLEKDLWSIAAISESDEDAA